MITNYFSIVLKDSAKVAIRNLLEDEDLQADADMIIQAAARKRKHHPAKLMHPDRISFDDPESSCSAPVEENRCLPSYTFDQHSFRSKSDANDDTMSQQSSLDPRRSCETHGDTLVGDILRLGTQDSDRYSFICRYMLVVLLLSVMDVHHERRNHVFSHVLIATTR